MASNIIALILAAIATERLTELLVESDITDILFRQKLRKLAAPPENPDDPIHKTTRAKITKRLVVFFKKLTDCGYCTSVWVAFGMSLLVPNEYYIIEGLVIHGLANLWHVIYELIRRGRIFSIDLTVSHKDDYSELVQPEVNEGDLPHA